MTSQPPSTRARKIFRVTFSIVFGLVLLELLLRFFWLVPVTDRGACLNRDDVADHSHYPWSTGRHVTREFDVILRMNNIGMRGDPVAIPKPAGVKRILVLGDSFMEGWGCQRGEIFSDRLQEELRKSDSNAEVVVAGVASWSTLTEFAWLKHKGLALEPDAVVVVFDVTDPAGDSFYTHRLVRDAQGRPDHIRRGARWFDIPEGLHNALLASYIYRQFDRHMSKRLPRSEWDFGYWVSTDDVWAPARSETEIPAPLYDVYWRPTREALVAMRDLLAEKKIPWMFVQFPIGPETDSSCWLPGRTTAKFPQGVIPPRRFRYVEKMTAADSIPYLSLYDAFRADSEPARLYFPYDGHWSPAGHALAAAAVAREIERRGMLRQVPRTEYRVPSAQ